MTYTSFSIVSAGLLTSFAFASGLGIPAMGYNNRSRVTPPWAVYFVTLIIFLGIFLLLMVKSAGVVYLPFR